MVSACDDIFDFELIRRMADHRTNFADALEAWNRFYIRHHRFLLRVCMSDHKYVLGVDGVQDVVQQAFLKAFEGAKTFNHAMITVCIAYEIIQTFKSRASDKPCPQD